jgi:DNA-directed RNA polymerase subunit RPC12/RpoP
VLGKDGRCGSLVHNLEPKQFTMDGVRRGYPCQECGNKMLVIVINQGVGVHIHSGNLAIACGSPYLMARCVA